MGAEFGTMRQTGIVQHGSQHVEQPCAAFVADGFVSGGKVGGVEALAESDGTGVAQALSIFISRHEIAAVFFEEFTELLGIFLLKGQQCSVVGQPFGDPLIAIRLPENQVAPPLMRRFVDEYLAVEGASERVEMKIGLLLRAEKGVARYEYESRPSLARA